MDVKIDDTAKVRETFTIPKYLSDQLKEFVVLFNDKKSRIVAKALEEYINKNKFKVAERKRSLQSLIEITENLPPGKIGEEKIQDILGKYEK